MRYIISFLLILAVSLSTCPQAFPESSTENYSASGKIHFVQYYSIGGKKCAAFLEQNNGRILCIVDNPAIYKLKEEIKKSSGDVKLIGTLNSDASNEFLDTEKYNVITDNTPSDKK